jgi:hypothetical protein
MNTAAGAGQRTCSTQTIDTDESLSLSPSQSNEIINWMYTHALHLL